VFRACRSVLGDHHDAEDCFQATFLVLAVKAGQLSLRGPLGPWLFGVARTLALRARSAAARRRSHERRAAQPVARQPQAVEPDVATLVLDAVARLPERLRAPVLLCDLDGLTYQQAADRLGWSRGTVRNRLARGRQRLRDMLARKGLAPAVALAAGATVTVPRALAAATARAAVLVAAGVSAGEVSESVIVLMNGGLHSMLWSKIKACGLSALTAAVLVAGALGLGAQSPATRPAVDPIQAEASTIAQVLDEYYVLLAAEPASPADRITRLAQEARRLEEAGDHEGARKVLRQLEDAAWGWHGQLRQKRDEGAKAAVPPRLSEYTKLYLNDRLAKSRSKAVESPTGKASNLSTPRGAVDVETRLRELEQKLDRLLKALDEKSAPRNQYEPKK
jgi:RNA polymerase sigma factor (sigma-70 family)